MATKSDATEKSGRLKLLSVLNALETDLGLRRGFPLEYETDEVEEALSASFERLHDFFRGCLGVDPNG